MPRPIVTDDDRQQIHQRVEGKSGPHAGAELMEDSLDNFRDYRGRGSKAMTKVTHLTILYQAHQIAEGAATVYLIFDQDDEKVAELEDYLFDQGLEVMVPMFDGEEADIKQAHIEKMIGDTRHDLYRECRPDSGLILENNELNESTRLWPGKPFHHKTVYLAPPMDRRKQRYRTHSADVVVQEGDEFNATPS